MFTVLAYEIPRGDFSILANVDIGNCMELDVYQRIFR